MFARTYFRDDIYTARKILLECVLLERVACYCDSFNREPGI